MPASAENDREVEDTAVSVIGGYLGAGKTTLVNHILRTADERVAVLVNDFGDINIDEDLIASQDGDTISLANGCICCSLVDGFSSALETVAELDPQPERLVIESSGVADPATVAAYGHGPGLTLDATIVVVDAETIRAKARDEYVGDTVVGQLGSADIIVLNKIDLVTDDDATATEEWLRGQCADAVIVRSADAVVDAALLFGVAPGSAAPPGEQAAAAEHGHLHADSLFESWTWTGEADLSRGAIDALMDSLPDSVVRVKGLVTVDDEERVMVLQRVGSRWSLRPFGPRPKQFTSQLVFIGLHGSIDDAWIKAQLL